MIFTLRQAAKAAGKSPGTISKAIANGLLSVVGKEGNSFQIEASELFRVFPVNNHANKNNVQSDNTEKQLNINEQLKIVRLEAELEAIRRENESLRADKEDYKRRLDEESTERRNLALLISDMRQEPPRKPVENRKSIWATLLGKKLFVPSGD